MQTSSTGSLVVSLCLWILIVYVNYIFCQKLYRTVLRMPYFQGRKRILGGWLRLQEMERKEALSTYLPRGDTGEHGGGKRRQLVKMVN